MRIFLVLFLIASTGWSQTYFVRSNWVEVKEEPTMSSKTIGTSVRGERLSVISKTPSGEWLQIRAAQSVGWIPKFVTMQNSMEETLERGRTTQHDFNVAERLRGDEAPDATPNTREPASVRKKKKKSSNPFGPAVKNQQMKIDLDALEKLDALKISDAELREFQKKAKLNIN